MASSKYPGEKILLEYGTRNELALSYGVSERTIYRWLNKASRSSGLEPKKPTRPRPATLARFKGTRKQLAQKYNVSERTVYRWMQAARLNGTEIEQRAKHSAYPGMSILQEPGSNKKLADKYNVSTRTISRWKNKARQDAGLPDLRKTKQWKKNKNGAYEYIGDEAAFEKQIEEAYNPENIFEPPEEDIESFDYEEPIESPFEEPFDEPFEVEDAEEYTGTDEDLQGRLGKDLGMLNALLYDKDLLVEGSAFKGLNYNQKIEYLNKYIGWQYEQNEWRFYNKETHEFDTSPEFVSNIDMWGAEFEGWLTEQQIIEDIGL